VNPNVRVLRCDRVLELRRECPGNVDVRVERMHLGRSGADERERCSVLSGIAAFQMWRLVLAVRDETVMLVSRETVVMPGVIVIVVDVGVQQGHCPRRGNQYRNEQQRQPAMHSDESMGRGQPGSKGGRIVMACGSPCCSSC
jgi:hypothetical protein